MDDDEPTSPTRYPLAAAKMSKVPSWIMLGFLLGAGFVAALPPLRKKPAPEPASFKAVEPPEPAAPRDPPQLTTIEAVFAVWGKHAVWSEDITEVALWNTQDRAFSEFYEVRRVGSQVYFRTLSRLTRRVISHGKPLPESPLQFTETEEQYQEWRQHGRVERATERDLRPSSPGRRSEAITPPMFERVEPGAPVLELSPQTTTPAGDPAKR